ncbi:USG-1 protein homolog [Pseudomonas marincola]|uniref:USG-1 protein homolog n=1 Tax=Pseudomonas marincola TaxID=437900 RepID=A0A653EA02_9PSED|nr:aspartate-semialdehyde dehydrogenase [Pseudomonas marincola]CAE6928704.1 USG-1 protein homolog [Pseudomonas marincola]
MSATVDVAVIGATGAVGEALVQVLEERDFPLKTLHLLGVDEAVGHSVTFRGKNLRVRAADEFDFANVQVAFFVDEADVTRECLEAVRRGGCAVIDLSAGLPAGQAPIVVADVNPQVMASLKAPYWVSSPAAVSVALSCVLAAIAGQVEVTRASVTACLAVSSRDRQGVTELARQTAELLNARAMEPRLFDRQIAFNLLAQVEEPDNSGHGALERRIGNELKTLLTRPQLKVAVTCIQAPVFFGDSLNVSLQTEAAVDIPAVCAALDASPAIEYVEPGDYPTAVGDAVGQDVIYVGRVRGGIEDEREVNLWITSDNVRKGTAVNAVQLAELLIKDHLSKILT